MNSSNTSTLSEKRPATAEPLTELLQARWSGRAFADRPIEAEALRALFEAARWAFSAANEQPWAFVVARRAEDPEAFARLAETLMPGNVAWAPRAAALVLTLARKAWVRSGAPNRHAFHDVGAATFALAVEATARGLMVHPMGGFDVAKATAACAVPETHEPVALLAIGHPGDAAELPAEVAEKDAKPRTRKPLAELVFGGRFGDPSPL